MIAISPFQFSVVVRYDDFVVRDHRVHNVRVLPGVTYLDMIYRYLIFKGFQADQIEVRNILFKQPLVTSESFDQRLRVTLDPSGRFWKVTARSQRVREGELVAPEWTDHLQAEIHLNQEPLKQKIDLPTLIRQARFVEEMDTAYSFLRQSGIVHYDVMKLRGQVYVGPDWVLGKVHLGDQARSCLDQFYLHPAFLDGSTCVAIMLILLEPEVPDMMKAKPTIPIYVQSFRAPGRYEEPSYVLIRAPDRGHQMNQDIVYADIEVYSEQGDLIALLKRIGSHRVRHEGLITRLGNTTAVVDPGLASGNR